MRFILFSLTLLTSWTLAQPSCEVLLDSFTEALETARSYSSTTTVFQGEKEVYYLVTDNRRDEAGEWQMEKLEERSALPFGDMGDGFGGDDDEDEETTEEACEGATVEQIGDDWLLELPQEEDSPVEEWTMTFTPYRDPFLPGTMQGRFDVRILLIPFRGTFTTSFEDWAFDLNYTSPGER